MSFGVFPHHKSISLFKIKLDFEFQPHSLQGSALSPACPPRKLGGHFIVLRGVYDIEAVFASFMNDYLLDFLFLQTF